MRNCGVKKIRENLYSRVKLVEGEKIEKGMLMFGYSSDEGFSNLPIKSNEYWPARGYYFIPEEDRPERRLFKKEISSIVEDSGELPEIVLIKKETTKKLKKYGLHEEYI